MSAQSEPNPNDSPRDGGARRVLTGVDAAGEAPVTRESGTPDTPATQAASKRNDLLYYWKSQQESLGYSQGVEVDNTVWLSGTAALDEDFNPVAPGDLAAQMEFIYRRIEESLADYGLDFRHIVRENMYVTDIPALIDALPYRKSIYADGPFPTSTTVQVNQLLVPGLMIEIEVTACRSLR
jgi:2-iminobutanoate/2-iminopropanoate deaminase